MRCGLLLERNRHRQTLPIVGQSRERCGNRARAVLEYAMKPPLAVAPESEIDALGQLDLQLHLRSGS